MFLSPLFIDSFEFFIPNKLNHSSFCLEWQSLSQIAAAEAGHTAGTSQSATQARC